MTPREIWRCVACGLPAPYTSCEGCKDPERTDDAQSAPKLAELGQVPLFPVGTLPPRSTKRGQSLLDL